MPRAASPPNRMNCRIRRWRHASRTLNVPRRLTSKNVAEFSLVVAIWMTTSAPSIVSPTACGSVMLPEIHVHRSPVTGVRCTNARTARPRCSRVAITWRPSFPLAPKTAAVFMRPARVDAGSLAAGRGAPCSLHHFSYFHRLAAPGLAQSIGFHECDDLDRLLIRHRRDTCLKELHDRRHERRITVELAHRRLAFLAD